LAKKAPAPAAMTDRKAPRIQAPERVRARRMPNHQAQTPRFHRQDPSNRSWHGAGYSRWPASAGRQPKSACGDEANQQSAP
jgi:hypothetical protein